jgi:hypothetical protein
MRQLLPTGRLRLRNTFTNAGTIVFDHNILQCKALAELLGAAHARILIGMAAYVEKIPADA